MIFREVKVFDNIYRLLFKRPAHQRIDVFKVIIKGFTVEPAAFAEFAYGDFGKRFLYQGIFKSGRKGFFCSHGNFFLGHDSISLILAFPAFFACAYENEGGGKKQSGAKAQGDNGAGTGGLRTVHAAENYI